MVTFQIIIHKGHQRVRTMKLFPSGGNTGAAFSIDTNGNIITTANTVDYETVQSFSLIVQATDGPGLTGI